MKYLRNFFIYIFVFVFLGCSDNATVNILDEKIANSEIKCMKLLVFPPDAIAQNSLKKLYNFEQNCSVELEVSLKRGIVCNSNQNSDKKVLSNFPTSYLRMQISKNKKLFYSYYIDLKDDVSAKDVESAFKRIEKDLILE
nr:hypothetical protein [uncultured Sulfurimonas sp.]